MRYYLAKELEAPNRSYQLFWFYLKLTNNFWGDPFPTFFHVIAPKLILVEAMITIEDDNSFDRVVPKVT